jgi:hypothetical protein
MVIVHIHHPRGRIHRLGDLVRVLRSRKAGSKVEELIDARLRHVPHGAAGQRAVDPGGPAAVRKRLLHFRHDAPELSLPPSTASSTRAMLGLEASTSRGR